MALYTVTYWLVGVNGSCTCSVTGLWSLGPHVQDEFLDVIYWLRQVLSLVLGLVWGLIPLQGYVGMLL